MTHLLYMLLFTFENYTMSTYLVRVKRKIGKWGLENLFKIRANEQIIEFLLYFPMLISKDHKYC